MPMMPKRKPKSGPDSPSFRISRELRDVSHELTLRLDGIAGVHVAWSLFVWTEGRASYIANADRRQVIDLLETMIERWKQGMPDVPAHERQ